MRTFTIGIAFAATLLLGCKTLDNSGLVNTVAGLAGQAARFGALAQMRNNPADRAYFETAKIALDGLLNSKDYNPLHLQEVLGSLPSNTLKGENSALVIEGSVLVYSVLTSTFFDIQSAPAVSAIITAIRNGFASALAVPAAPATPQTLVRSPLLGGRVQVVEPEPSYEIKALRTIRL